ncbi:ComF family protein [Paenibacillus sp. 5J-6]|uniref:ComF family protein n=1 Tax=Paenibacillus silvestris TaxID=2606219 RepID=A0A6L8UWW6_9BACL|nr:ComF family protein [Paenibacillus silvestris]MZQ82384.1 ComF family protein [Paenibacillus silvestris]
MRVWKNWLSVWRETFFSLLSPMKEECLLCKQTSSDGVKQLGLCGACYMRIPWIRTVVCEICGRGERCFDCKRRHAYFSKSRSAVRYDETMKDLLARYKYRGDERLKTVLGQMLMHSFQLLEVNREALNGKFEIKKEYITFVPVSDQRMHERGFNQAEQMALELGRRVGIPVVSLLKRSRHTDKQSFKKRIDRLDDLEHVFEVDDDLVHKYIKSSSATSFLIYIIDDVYTTGSTMNQCAKILTVNLPIEVYGLTWAR